jgi:hypothetical protein
MKILLRVVAVLFVAVAIALVAIVISVATSDGGAKPVVAILYILGAIVLCIAAARLWRGPRNTAAGV